MGNAKSTATVKISNELITESVNNMLVRQLQSHRVSSAIVQNVDLTAKGDINFGTINMNSLADIKLDSWQKMQNKAEFQKVVEQSLRQQSDAQAEAEQSFLTLGNSEAETNQDIRNRAINKTVNNLDVKQVNECLASAYTKQSIKLVSKEGGITFDAIDMNATSKVAAKCIADTVQRVYTSQIDKYTQDQTGDAKTTAVNKGIFESLGELVGQVVAAIGSIVTGPIRFVIYTVIALIILSIVVSIARSFMTGGGTAENTYAPLDQPSMDMEYGGGDPIGDYDGEF